MDLKTYTISFFALSILALQSLLAQTEEDILVQFIDAPLTVILSEYESISGSKIIRDQDIDGIKMSVETVERMSRAEALAFIEKTLLLNGYALLGTEEPGQLKIVGFTKGKHPRSEGVPLIRDELQLPITEEIVMFVMKFDHLTTEDAQTVLTSAFPLHPYGNISPVPGRKSIVVTESSLIVRQMLDLKDLIDVPEEPFSKEIFCLERIDAVKAAEILTNLYTPEAQSTAAEGASKAGSGGFVFQPVSRSNSLFVRAPTDEFPSISETILKMDAPGTQYEIQHRRLKYLEVEKFLQVAQSALYNTDDVTVEGQQPPPSSQANINSLASNSLASNSFPTGGQSNLTADLGTAGFEEEIAPISMVVGKTLLVGDVTNNSLMIKGPPEDCNTIMELIDSMDIRPKQIQLTAVIAQLNLGNDFDFGMDFVRTIENPTARNNGAGIFSTRALNNGGILDIPTLENPSNFAPAAQGLTLYGQLNPYLNSFISSLQETNRFRVLSRPIVYALNNQRAVIQTGQRIAVPRSTLSTVDPSATGANQIVTAAIDFEEVVLRVEVIPLINSDDEITLSIKQTNDDIVGSQIIGGNSIPTIGTQGLGTKVIVKNGSAVLLGGLISEQDSHNKSGLPIFVNLPLVGNFFGASQRERDRQELLIFIQPRIIDGDKTHKAVDSQLGETSIMQTDPRDEFYDLNKQKVEDTSPKNKGLKKFLNNNWRWRTNRE